MKKLDKLFFNCEKSLADFQNADKDNIALKLIYEQDRKEWEQGEFDALMLLIDKSAKTLDDAETQHNIDRHIRDLAIKKLSNKKKYKLITQLLDKDLDLPF
jgi:hypothetical protein